VIVNVISCVSCLFAVHKLIIAQMFWGVTQQGRRAVARPAFPSPLKREVPCGRSYGK
jgi:hypothetical protein